MTESRNETAAGKVAGAGCALAILALAALALAIVFVGGWKLLAWLAAL